MRSNRKRRDGPDAKKSARAKASLAPGVRGAGLVIGVLLVASSLVLLMNRPIHPAVKLTKTGSGTNALALNSPMISNAADSRLSDSEQAAQFSNRGTALFQQGKIEAAAHDFAEAMRLTPEDETAHFNLGSAQIGRAHV